MYNKELLKELKVKFTALSYAVDLCEQTNSDLYSYIASVMYGRPLNECGECNPDGSQNTDGKDLRNRAKQFLLPTIAKYDGIFDTEVRDV